MKILLHKLSGWLLGIPTTLGGKVKLKGAFIHHTGGTKTNPRASTKHHTAEGVNNYHKGLWGNACRSSIGNYGGYTFFFGQGKVTQFRSMYEMGCHTKGYNFGYIAFCIAGNGDVESFDPRDLANFKAKWLEVCDEHPELIGKLRGHRAVANKSCPGNLVTNGWIVQMSYAPILDTIERLNKQRQEIKGHTLLLEKLQAKFRGQLEAIYKKTL